MLLLIKSHIQAYVKKDGTFVAAHEDSRTKQLEAQPGKSLNEVYEEAKAYVLKNGGKDNIEHSRIYDKQGKTLIEKSGTYNHISYDPNEQKILLDNPGTVLVHNHPIGMSLSGADLKFGSAMKCKDVIAIGPDGSEFTGHINDFKKYLQIEPRVAQALDKDRFTEVKKGLYTDDQFQLFRDHMKNSILALMKVIDYTAKGMRDMPPPLQNKFNALSQNLGSIAL
jgi:hypothetical protein